MFVFIDFLHLEILKRNSYRCDSGHAVCDFIFSLRLSFYEWVSFKKKKHFKSKNDFIIFQLIDIDITIFKLLPTKTQHLFSNIHLKKGICVDDCLTHWNSYFSCWFACWRNIFIILLHEIMINSDFIYITRNSIFCWSFYSIKLQLKRNRSFQVKQ